MIITPEMAKHAEDYCDVLGLTDKPFWKDSCGHDKDAYVCSFVIAGFFHQNREYQRKIDMYVFKAAWEGQALCLRTGDADSNYCSPGRVTDFIINNRKDGSRHYRTIVDLLCYLGRIKWEPAQF